MKFLFNIFVLFGSIQFFCTAHQLPIFLCSTKEVILSTNTSLRNISANKVTALLRQQHQQFIDTTKNSKNFKGFWLKAFELKDRRTFRASPPKWSFLFKLDDRETFIRKAPVDETGLQIGLQRRNWKFWVGYSYIKAPARESFKVETRDTLRTILDLQYATIAPEYIVYYHKLFEVSGALGFGAGESNVVRTLNSGQPKQNSRFFLPLEPALKLVVKPTRWVGLSASVGYRKTLSFTDTTVNYDGWFYSYGISLFLGNILGDLKIF